MTIEIRTATPGDVAVLVELSKPVQALHVQHRPTQFREPRQEEVRDWYAEMLAKPEVAAWIAHVDGQPAGYLLSVSYHRPANPFCFPRAHCEVDQVCVTPQYRRQGVATALFEAVFAHARQAQLGGVQLTYWSFNDAAQATFRALGFRDIVTRLERKP